MGTTKFLKAIQSLFFATMLVMASCLNAPNSVRNIASTNTKLSTGSGSATNGTGTPAVSDTTTVTSAGMSQIIELSHLVDPFTGTYKKKITIPKNYKGYLYIAGLNLQALNGKLIKVRLNYGVDRQSIVMPATLSRAPGITPKTDIQVLILDLTKRPLQDMKLPYDLFDYNDYNGDTSLSPVTDPTDSNLYCRGLKLSDDPTYSNTNSTGTCSTNTDKCLYAYAKISDVTFYNSSSSLATTPTNPSVWSSSTTLSTSMVSNMCLPDYNLANFNSLFSSYIPTGYEYNGPYRPINQSSWEIKSNAYFATETDTTVSPNVTHFYGLFEGGNYTADGAMSDRRTWYKSLMFPRSGTLALSTGVNYVGTTVNPLQTSNAISRDFKTVDSTAASKYVDGCNLRVMNYDSASNEGIGSCNVTGTIEVYYMNGTSEVNITTSKDLKIQLSRASNTNSEGKQVLSSTFKTCETSATCGSDECCYNSRCWSKDLVSQCVDDITQTGNRENGTSCTTDFQCASLCCNASTGSCSPHNPNTTTPILCSKSPGQSCVSVEFCAQQNVAKCNLYKTGTNVDGSIKCQIRCPAVATYGTCTGGICIAPAASTDTSTFNTTTCAGAIDP
jgi:hypothetical protein